MKNQWRACMRVSAGEKVGDGLMLTRTVVTVMAVVICLVAMGISAYAYFSHEVNTSGNGIHAASFDISVSVLDQNQQTVTVVSEIPKNHTVTLEPGSYSITLTPAGNAKTGFCIITAENCQIEKYYTQQLGMDIHSGSKTESITFTITVDHPTDVTFYAHWGTSSYYAEFAELGAQSSVYIMDQTEVIMPIVPADVTQ